MQRKLGRSATVQVFNDGDLVTVETIRGRGLRIVADVRRALSPEANACTISIWNLNQITRDRISQKVKSKIHLTEADKAILEAAGAGVSLAPIEVVNTNLGIATIRLAAGYGNAPLGMLFEGTSSRITHERDSPTTWRTTIECGEGSAGIREATLDKSYAPGTPVSQVITDLVRRLGATISPLTRATLDGALLRDGVAVRYYPYGHMCQGKVLPQLREQLAFLDVQWTIQDGEFLLLGPAGVLPEPPIDLRVETGLVGSPRRREAGGLDVTMLLDHRARPGASIALTSREAVGVFRVDESLHRVDTWGDGPHMSQVRLSSLSPTEALP